VYSTTVQYDCTVQLYSVVGELATYLFGLRIEALNIAAAQPVQMYSLTVQCTVYSMTVQYDCTVQYSTCHKWGNLQWLTNIHSGGQCTVQCTVYSVQCTVYSTTVQYNSTVQLYSTTVQYDCTVQLYSTTVQCSGELAIHSPILYRRCC
jgi:hypothetical protein